MQPPSGSDWVALAVALMTVIVGIVNYLTVRAQRRTAEESTVLVKDTLNVVKETSGSVTSVLSSLTRDVPNRLDTMTVRLDTLVGSASRTEAQVSSISRKIK